jgi:quinoprotein glucose dehydrogenase
MAALAENTDSSGAQATYMSQCSVCHGEKMGGAPPAIPSLIGIAKS